MTPDDLARARDALGAVLQAITSGGLDADPAQLDSLRRSLAELESQSSQAGSDQPTGGLGPATGDH